MDRTVDSSLKLGPLVTQSEWDSFSGDVPVPLFNLQYQTAGKSPDSFLAASLQADLQTFYSRIEQLNIDGSLLNQLIESIHPFRGAVGKSKYNYTSDYYDMLTLDVQFGLLNVGDRVLLFTPKARRYFAEKQSRIFVNIFKAGISDNKGVLAFDINNSPPDAELYVLMVNRVANDVLILPAFDKADLNQRWKTLDDTLSTAKVNMIVLEEDPLGRTGDYLEKSQVYDIQFMESVLRGPRVLANGGKAVVKFNSMATRLTADILYIYKFLFRELSLIKPASSSPVSFDHYLVAKGFNEARYMTFKPAIDEVLTNLADDLATANENDDNLYVYSYLSNLEAASNFTQWLVSENNRMSLWIYSNILALGRLITDRQDGFREGHPVLNIDHAQYREALGKIGRTTLQNLPEFSEEGVSDQTGEAVLTETGQEAGTALTLETGLFDQLNSSFIQYLGLLMLTDDIMRSDLIAVFLPLAGTIVEQKPVSTDQVYIKRRNYAFYFRQWLGRFRALGDFDLIFGDNSYLGETGKPKLIKLLSDRKWSMFDLFEISNVRQDFNLPLAYDRLASSIGRMLQFVQGIKALSPEQLSVYLNSISLRMNPLDNLRYRLAFSLNGVKYGLMTENDPSVIGEYELVNLLRPNEAKSLDDFQNLAALFNKRAFLTRVFNFTCLPVYLAGESNEIAVPDFYFTYRPDLEYFASAVNRHAPFWCSADPEEIGLGSLGNFWGPISSAEHPIYADGRIKLGVAFPPPHFKLFSIVFPHLLKLINDLAAQNKTYAVIIIYPVQGEYSEYIDSVATEISDRSVAFTDLSRIYDPFAGVHRERSYNAICFKTPKSTFRF